LYISSDVNEITLKAAHVIPIVNLVLNNKKNQSIKKSSNTYNGFKT